MSPAIGGSVSVRNCTDASVLNRKWGSTCACISFSSQYLGPRVCLAVLEQEQQTDKKAVAKSADESPHEGVGMRGNLGQSIALNGQSIALDQNHQRHSYRRADRDAEHEPPHRMRLFPGRYGIDEEGDRKPEALRGDEWMPERPCVLDVLDRRVAGVDRQDQRESAPR